MIRADEQTDDTWLPTPTTPDVPTVDVCEPAFIDTLLGPHGEPLLDVYGRRNPIGFR